MWRCRPIHVSSISQALMMSAASLWMTLGTSHADGTLVTYVRTTEDAVISQMLIKETTINDYRLNLFENGANPFNFVAVEFNVNTSGKYYFGQQEAPMDTVMLLYKGGFDPRSVKTNLVAVNDDWYRFDNLKMGSTYNTRTPAASCTTEAYNCLKLDTDTTLVLKKCGDFTKYCPGMFTELEANTKYYMVVTHYESKMRLQFQLPQTFWCYGGSCTLKTVQVAPPTPDPPTPTPPAPTPPAPIPDPTPPAPKPDPTPTPPAPTTPNPITPTDTEKNVDDTNPPKTKTDPVTTFLSLITQERGLAQMMTLSASRLVNAVEHDCAQFDAQGMCVSFRMRATMGTSSHEGAGIFILSKQVGPHLRVGTFVDYVVTSRDPVGFQVKDQRPTFGAFVGYRQQPEGGGFHGKFAVAYHSGQLISQREIILNSEAGTGTATLQGYVLRGEVAYTSQIAKVLITPYVALRHLQVIRDRYSETLVTGAVEAPLSFNQSRLKLATTILGLRVEGRITTMIGYQVSVAGEYDALRRISAMSGTSTIEKLETFGIQRSFNKDPIRLSATAGLFWEFSKTNRLFAQSSASGNPRQPGAITTLLGYQVSF